MGQLRALGFSIGGKDEMSEMKKLIVIDGDPQIAISNFDQHEGWGLYGDGAVCLTRHYDGDMDGAGSVSFEGAIFITSEAIPGVIAALKEFSA